MKKAWFKGFCLVLAAVMVLSISAFSPAILTQAEGYGSNGKFIAPIGEYEVGSTPISTRAQLEAIRNNLGGKYHLAANIDLSGTSWAPIGDKDNYFIGVFDGQGYVIRNLTVGGDYAYAGLFGYAIGATIKNVGLEDASVSITTARDSTVGGLCGYNFGMINNCYFSGLISYTGSSSSLKSWIGSICGNNSNNGIISNSYNMGIISSSGYGDLCAGGICGFNSGDGNINNTFNTGTVSSVSSSYFGYAYAGGICGKNSDAASINNSYSTGTINAEHAGGICGFSDSNGSINNCNNGGAINGNRAPSYSGGICGKNKSIIDNCRNTGIVSDNNQMSYFPSATGGICGNSENIINDCYNIGAISGGGNIGGICGDSSSNIRRSYNIGSVSNGIANRTGGIAGGITGIANNCYWNTDSPQIVSSVPLLLIDKRGTGSDPDNTTPLSSEAMKQQSSFAGFDFTTIWAIDPEENDGYPVFRAYDIDANAVGKGVVAGSGGYGCNAEVILIATPNAGCRFDGWYENNTKVAGAGAMYTFKVSANRTLEARFTYLLGNVSGSGKLAVTDARMVLQYLVGKSDLTPTQLDIADADGSGDVTIADARLILQRLVGKIDKFPVE